MMWRFAKKKNTIRQCLPQGVCCLPSWNMCRPETCFRLALFAILKNVPFWNMLQIGSVPTLSYQSHMLNGRSQSIKTCEMRPKVRTRYCICLFVCFSVIKIRATSNAVSWKDIIVVCPKYDKSLHISNLKLMFQNGMFFGTAHNTIWNMF